MNPKKVSPAQIRKRGLEMLAGSLGPVGMAYFLQQFDTASGNYTRDRAHCLGNFYVGFIKDLKLRPTLVKSESHLTGEKMFLGNRLKSYLTG